VIEARSFALAAALFARPCVALALARAHCECRSCFVLYFR